MHVLTKAWQSCVKVFMLTTQSIQSSLPVLLKQAGMMLRSDSKVLVLQAYETAISVGSDDKSSRQILAENTASSTYRPLCVTVMYFSVRFCFLGKLRVDFPLTNWM